MVALLFYIGLGALLTLEEAGVFFLPGDISLVAAGLHSAQGGSIVFISWIAGSAGMIIGSSILFHGVSQSDSVGRVVPVRVVSLIHRHQVKGVAVARLVPGLRNATVFAAAGARLPYRTFLFGLVPAALVWSGLLLALGWFGGAAMLATFGQLHHSPFLKLLSFGLLLAAAIYLWIRLRKADDSEVERAPSVCANDASSG
jgi:membrane protein DedA with SNARE-associated domain